jgi:hypothetical protein
MSSETEVPNTATTAARLVSRADLSSDEFAQMYRLLTQHFNGVTQEQFHQDTSEKNWVVLIERAGRIVGFSTILAYETLLNKLPHSVIYSGDTIVAPEAWNTSALPRAWIESVAKLRQFYARGPYLWMLITSGFRTYRFLPLFWREFVPRFDISTPQNSKQLLDHLASERFGRQYDPVTGIVRFKNPQRLRDSLSDIPAGRLEDPHVAFFAAQNPGHADGDELVCLTELTPGNLTAAGRRMTAAISQW